VTYTLGNNIENLTLTGSGNINGTGNTGDNTITGNTRNNTLDGGAGADTLIGGDGDDTYIVDNAGDVVTESAGQGTDTVEASINYSLGANVENLTLTGSGNINGTGNTLNNTLTGNTGNNTLDGGAGNDTLIGGDGDDFFNDNVGNNNISGGNGNDTLSLDGKYSDYNITYNSGTQAYTLIRNSTSQTNVVTGVENFQFTSGNKLASELISIPGNTLTGTTGNDTLNGSSGAYTLVGGLGNDTYVVDSADDVVTELVSEGIDRVNASINYSLTANVEDLFLTGSGNINGTGNTSNNYILGNSGNNTLNGGAGNDVLDGGAGMDTLIGGTGNDGYIVDNAGDVVTELAGEGTDTVYASINYSLGATVENLALSGSGNINGTGNSGDNYIGGNSGNNTLDGGDGDDRFSDDGGNNNILGGNGNDTLALDRDYSAYNITYNSGTQAYTLINTVTGATNVVTGVENFEFEDGNKLASELIANNTLTGTNGNDTLNGSGGAYTLIGLLGNDTYVVDSADDVLTELANEGTDTVNASVTYTLGSNVENLNLTGSGNINGTGNALNNTLTGNTGNNTLDGGDGDDFFNDNVGNNNILGGNGNDTLSLDGKYSDYNITYDSGTQAYTLIRNSTNQTNVVTGVENFQFKDIDLTSTVLASLIGPEVSGQMISGGTPGADVITVNSNINNSTSNNLFAGGGDDIVYAEGSTNVIDTGSGNDTIHVMAGNDQRTFSSIGNDTTKVYSGATNARLSGGDGDDLFEIFAGADNTRILGGNDNDTIQISGNSTNNLVTGGAGVDTVRFEGKASDYTTSLDGSNLVYSKGGQVVATFLDTIENVKFTEL
jgi:Ca2+-binding RTX toxin-like protein